MAKHYALVIGLDEGSDRNLQTLRYACADAKALHATFADALGYGKAARLLLQPNSAAVRQALSQIRAEVRAGDTLVTYFAGHGAQHGEDQYLLLRDANLRDLEAGDIAGNDLLSLRWLVNQVADWPRVHAAFILDMCRTPLRSGARSGAGAASYSAQVEQVLAGIGARDMGFTRASAADATTPSDQDAVRPPPLVVNACADGQQAFELERLGRGQFSHSLERWLRSGQTQGQARVLGPHGVGEISRLLDETASEYEGPRGQRPWLNPGAPEVILYNPAEGSVPTSSSQKLQVLTSAPAMRYALGTALLGGAAITAITAISLWPGAAPTVAPELASKPGSDQSAMVSPPQTNSSEPGVFLRPPATVEQLRTPAIAPTKPPARVTEPSPSATATSVVATQRLTVPTPSAPPPPAAQTYLNLAQLPPGRSAVMASEGSPDFVAQVMRHLPPNQVRAFNGRFHSDGLFARAMNGDASAISNLGAEQRVSAFHLVRVDGPTFSQPDREFQGALTARATVYYRQIDPATGGSLRSVRIDLQGVGFSPERAGSALREDLDQKANQLY